MRILNKMWKRYKRLFFYMQIPPLLVTAFIGFFHLAEDRGQEYCRYVKESKFYTFDLNGIPCVPTSALFNMSISLYLIIFFFICIVPGLALLSGMLNEGKEAEKID